MVSHKLSEQIYCEFKTIEGSVLDHWPAVGCSVGSSEGQGVGSFVGRYGFIHFQFSIIIKASCQCLNSILLDENVEFSILEYRYGSQFLIYKE